MIHGYDRCMNQMDQMTFGEFITFRKKQAPEESEKLDNTLMTYFARCRDVDRIESKEHWEEVLAFLTIAGD
jgi:hypothetical protein